MRRSLARAVRLALLMSAAVATPVVGQEGGSGEPRPARTIRAVDDSLATLIEAADERLARGQVARAVEEYRRAQQMLGLHLLYGEADRFYYEESARIHAGLARAYLETGDPFAARIEASRGLNLTEDDAGLWTLLGSARYRLTETEDAEWAFRRALELDPDRAEAHWGLALVAVASNRIDLARRHGGEAVQLDPRARYALGLARWAAIVNDHPAATEALDDYLRWIDGGSAPGYRNLRRFYAWVAEAPANRVDPRVRRAQINFDLKRGDEIPYVPVRFNGGEVAYVLFDTGAEFNVVDRRFARSIGVDTIVPGGGLRGAYRRSPGGYTLVDSLEIGSFRIQRVPFSVADFEALNLRGQGSYYIAAVINPALLFRDFRVVIDFRHRRIELERYGAGGRGRRLAGRSTTRPFRFDANGVWPVIPVRLDGSSPLPFLLDTGSSDVVVERETANVLRLDPRRLHARTDGFAAPNLRAVLHDGSLGEPWGVRLHGILGFPFFRNMRVAFDYRTMTLELSE
ncbi:MAG: aspartyl protease family protein [Gemmatimonadota bacterium]|nr:aspartyl protease family protein [Gemmatimonadota bacterium]